MGHGGCHHHRVVELAAIAVEFFYLFIARILNTPDIAELADNELVNIVTTLVFIAIATFIASRASPPASTCSMCWSVSR